MNVVKLPRPDAFEKFLATVARRRGYNPDRVALVAQQFDEAARRMNQVEIRFPRALPSDATEQELQTAANEIAVEAGRQVLRHCLREFSRVVIDLSWPKEL